MLGFSFSWLTAWGASWFERWCADGVGARERKGKDGKGRERKGKNKSPRTRMLTRILLIFSCIFVVFFWGRQREIQQKGRGANENNKYLSHLSSLNFAAT